MTQIEAINSSTVNPRSPLGRRLRIGLSGGLLAPTLFLAGNHLAALDKASAMRSSPAYAATPIPNPDLNGTTQLANLVCTDEGAPTQYAP
ncbi:hypothetical protein [Sulfitobacter sp. 1A16808]|uniref:hypothetical protein n=1 Tax=Sulfitobacter sp. 1A16808 TaxID=3368572 RepID=UPI0037477B54